jgi:hypothetical protein
MKCIPVEKAAGTEIQGGSGSALGRIRGNIKIQKTSSLYMFSWTLSRIIAHSQP